jgi:hypothetical protein
MLLLCQPQPSPCGETVYTQLYIHNCIYTIVYTQYETAFGIIII